jgi:glycosyltransferase involved in cell wall biosynthesis
LATTYRLNVVVPCYNPPEGWEEALADKFNRFSAFVADLAPDVRLVVVNDGSVRNATPAHFERLNAHLPGATVVSYAINRGKGYALRQGVAALEADGYLVTDADFPYDLPSMRRVVECLKAHGGVAAGNRDAAYYDRVPGFRKQLSKTFRWFLRNVMRQPIADSQCGLKAFDAAGKAVFLQTTIDRFLFDLEFLMLASRAMTVHPVPVELREGVVFSPMGMNVLATESGNFLHLIWRAWLAPGSLQKHDGA